MTSDDCPCPECTARRDAEPPAERDLADVLLGQARNLDRHRANERRPGPA